MGTYLLTSNNIATIGRNGLVNVAMGIFAIVISVSRLSVDP